MTNDPLNVPIPVTAQQLNELVAAARTLARFVPGDERMNERTDLQPTHPIDAVEAHAALVGRYYVALRNTDIPEHLVDDLVHTWYERHLMQHLMPNYATEATQRETLDAVRGLGSRLVR